MTTTGVAVFAYNRPEHLKHVLQGLRKNGVNHLYIFSDGASDGDDLEEVNRVRSVIDSVDWCETTTEYRDSNVGLAESLTTGINRVFEDHDQIVVLEDDCVPASNFISFMKDCLEKYRDNEQVMNINGYSPPISIPETYQHDIYFTRRNSSWGWGTWQSSWDSFEQAPIDLDYIKTNRNEVKKTLRKAGSDLLPMIKKQLQGEIDSWAVWWSYAIASSNGVCVNPVDSKIRNIGHDDTGTHTGSTDRYDVTIDDTDVDNLSFPSEVFINDTINSRYNKFISGGRRNRIKKRIRNFLELIGLWRVYKIIYDYI